MPQSARVNELLSSTPAEALAIAAVLLGMLAAVAALVQRWSATAAAVLLSAGGILVLPYWVFAFRESWFTASVGMLLSLAAIGRAQRYLIEGNGSGYWRRFLDAWGPLALACFLGASMAFRGFSWRIGLAVTVPIAVSALAASWLPARTTSNRVSSWASVAAGIIVSIGSFYGLQWAGRQANLNRHQAVLRQLETTPAPLQNQPYERYFFQRGVSLVADRESFGSDVTHALLKDLAAHGVDAISIVVHGLTPRPNQFRESHESIELLSRRAHLLGMKVLLKPHHKPRGQEMDSAESRGRWFARHSEGMEQFGRLATRIHADLFCIGYEMGKAYQYEAEWRQVIARARAVYSGPLTACPTQGEEFEGIRFWDALDYIGIDNYYPVPDNYDYSGIVKKLEAVHRQYQKPLLFTEAGFASVENSHRQPWAEPRRALSLEEQEKCYKAMLEAVYDKPWFMGVYWWKIDTDGPGGPRDRSLTPWRKPAMELVKSWYSSNRRRTD